MDPNPTRNFQDSIAGAFYDRGGLSYFLFLRLSNGPFTVLRVLAQSVSSPRVFRVRGIKAQGLIFKKAYVVMEDSDGRQFDYFPDDIVDCEGDSATRALSAANLNTAMGSVGRRFPSSFWSPLSQEDLDFSFTRFSR
jgi:hypothetical protein